MFPEMRRKKQLMSEEDNRRILKDAKTGILGVSTIQHPSMTPLNYVMFEDAIWFHCAQEGYKLKVIKENPAVTFCVVGKDEVIQEEYSSSYESVVVYGTAKIIEDLDVKRKALLELVKKYCPIMMDQAESYIEAGVKDTGIVKINIEHLSGKYHD